MFIPMFEDVRKKDGKARIQMRRLFPGYFFIETDTPEDVFDALKRIPEFTRLLGSEEDDEGAVFTPVEGDDQKFLESLMENGVMRVSYIQRASSGRIEKKLGPLSKYSNRVVKFDISRRRAIVQVDIFGKVRKLKFGLWTENDDRLPWIDNLLAEDTGINAKKLLKGTADIGIYPGDKVVDETGVYEDQVFTVDRVDTDKRIIDTSLEMFGTVVKVQLSADEVRKI
jgi:transcription antitermination factor NusG